MRKMAQVVTVSETRPIQGRDRIKVALFEEHGYEAVVGPDVRAGDRMVWIEHDSVLPDIGRWGFLREKNYSERLGGILIRPRKFGGVRSWGIAVGFEMAFPDAEERRKAEGLAPGSDLTEMLGIWKSDADGGEEAVRGGKKKGNGVAKLLGGIPLIGGFLAKMAVRIVRFFGGLSKMSSAFPTDIISKSDETCLQSMEGILERWKDEPFIVTAKMEGQSATAVFELKGRKRRPGRFFVCSRNMAFRKREDNAFWNFAEKHHLEDRLRSLYSETGKVYCIQAEQCGPGIQGNIYGHSDIHWYLYSAKDEATGEQVGYDELRRIAMALGIDIVPLLMRGKRLGDLMPDQESAVEYASKRCFGVERCENGDTRVYQIEERPDWKNRFQNEGIVVRSERYDKDSGIGFSFKVKNIEYAEKGTGTIRRVVADSMFRRRTGR